MSNSSQRHQRRSTLTPSNRALVIWLYIGVPAAILIVTGAALLATFRPFGPEPAPAPAPTTGIRSPAASAEDQVALPPWPAPTNVPELVQAADLTLGPMGTAEHYHPELTITVNGHPVPIPANIGVNPRTGQMAELHTHTPDGVIHIEAARTGQRFTLGQLFTLWNVKLTESQIGGLHAKPGARLTVNVNGKPVPGNPAHLRLAPKQHIKVVL